jgi:lysozyme
MDRALLRSELIRDEGRKLKPYRDTLGILTIGVGRNLEQRGISQATSDQMLDEDIGIAESELDQNAPWWRSLSDSRQRGILNMAFNMGWPRLSGFRAMLSALQTGEFEKAATEALNSKWAGQVGDRAKRIAEMFRAG